MNSPESGVPTSNPQQVQPEQAKPLATALHKLSEERPQVLQEVLAMGGMSIGGHPLHQKMNAEHITQILTLATAHDERQFTLTKQSNELDAQEKTSTRRYFFVSFIIIVLLAGLILIMFRNKPEILIPCLTGLGGLVAGAAAGFGLGRRSED